jgi:hypothetical protein
VHREDDRAVGGAFVEVVDAQRAALGAVRIRGNVDVIRRERVAVEVGESFVGGAE